MSGAGLPSASRPGANNDGEARPRGPLAVVVRFLHELLFSIGPARNDHQPALRVALGVFVPLLALTLANRLDLAIFASFAAFTGIYGRNEPHRVRVVAQARAGLLMLGVILAATLAARLSPGGALTPWEIVEATTIVAWLCSVLVGLWRLRPAGSLFHIFAFAAVSSLPHQPPLADAVLAAGATFALCLAIGLSSRVTASRRSPLAWADVRAAARVRLGKAERRAVWLESIGYLVAPGIAGVAATAVGQALGFGHNYWAMVAAVVPLVGHSTRHRASRGLQRVLGTVVGLVLLAGIAALRPAPWAMVVLIAVCQFGAEMLIARQYFLAQVCVTPLALLSTLLAAHTDPGALLHDRFIDTAIGSVVGVAVVLAPHAYRRTGRLPSLSDSAPRSSAG
ncbi:FUSC family protein [Sinomonas sp. JGH33]|uniref:FUSC family protein n=1 Tax=Sinomonas terricola TaxID=3110330 RepID=A0ABU5T8F4_9MICC|nr:FUSC family protein [Sinomonas sp. JGH33]MEA5455970.1 FUSC family protein [Sinomonas sp. JGH33]